MIAWTVPGALAGLVLLAGPVIVHLLLRRRARQIIFPTTRFLQATTAAAVTLRSPSDFRLLMLRAAIPLTAVLAAAQPVLLAGWRTARWNERVARAIVLDTSRSVQANPEGSRLAQQELKAFAAARFDADDLEDGLQAAVSWLAHAPPARREVVIISDFQRGAIEAAALATVPADIGIRFVRAGVPVAPAANLLPTIAGWRGSRWQPSLVLNGDRLDAAWTRAGASNESWISTSAIPSETEAAARALKAAMSLGIVSGDDGRRVRIAFKGAPPNSGETEVRTQWMLRALVALDQSSLLREAGAAVQAFEENGALVIRTDISAAAANAPAVVRAVMLAIRSDQIVDRELETTTIPDAQLSEWRRDAAPMGTRPGVPVSDGTEARWLWGLALALLGIESWARHGRSAAGRVREVRADAA